MLETFEDQVLSLESQKLERVSRKRLISQRKKNTSKKPNVHVKTLDHTIAE